LFTFFVGKERENEEEEEKEKFYAIDTGDRKGHTQLKRKADWRQFHAFNLKSSFKKQKTKKNVSLHSFFSSLQRLSFQKICQFF
jgi:hypothetical protein